MDAERLRSFLLTLPHTVETVQWGGSLVFWVGDKAIGGKMFAVVRLSSTSRSENVRNSGDTNSFQSARVGQVISYAAGPERYSELLETEGIHPAPYLARAYWVAIERWSVFRTAEWEQQLTAAHTIIYNKLPPRTRAVLDMPAIQQRRILAERRKLIAARSR